MLSAFDMDLVRQTVEEQELDLHEVLQSFPDFDQFGVRRLYADIQRERRAPTDSGITSSMLSQVGSRAQDAYRQGFFESPTIRFESTLPPVFPSVVKVGHTVGVISDLHGGTEHDWSAIDVAIQVLQAAGIDELVINGDLFHCESFSRHAPAPGQHTQWVEERPQALLVPAYVRRAFPGMRIQMNYGNHDLWPKRWIAQNARALDGFITLEQVLGLDQFGFEVSPLGRIVIADKLFIKHGTKISQDAGQSAKKEIMSSFMATCMGHVHRLGYTETRKGYHEIHDEQAAIGVEGGCLCSLSPKYKADEDTSNWSQGFSLFHFDEEGHMSSELVSIHNGKAHFRGRVFRSRLAPGTTYQELAA
jgi:predicted phosphodiesterase